ncbi:MAG: protein-export membrane protein SecF [Candidatus Micrarchaeota archaeon]|nr:MAG: protein-export membrane protein SecF [Candidatus Micrarchaeota archaeon]
MLNIYQRNYKLYPIIPIVIVLASILSIIIAKLPLSINLTGGTLIIVNQSSNYSLSYLQGSISRLFPSSVVTVTKNLNQIDIYISANSTLSAIERSYENIQADYNSYQQIYSNITVLRSEGNSSYLSLEPSLQLLYNKILSNFTSEQLKAADLGLRANNSYNSSNISSVIKLSLLYFNESQARYYNMTISKIRSVINADSYTIESVSPEIGSYFLNDFIDILIAAFVMVFIAVYIIFRDILPAFTIVLGALADISIAMSALVIFHLPLGITSLAALLMIIGFSIDTEVLAAIRIIKRHEDTKEIRAFNSMKTGLTMTSSALIAFTSMLVFSIIFNIATYEEIASILIIGLIGDIFTTWFGTTPVILSIKK